MKLLTLLEFLLELGESIDVAQSGLLDVARLCYRLLIGLLLTSSLASLASLGLLLILEDAAVAQDDALSILVELDNLELEFLVLLCRSTVFLNKVLRSSKAQIDRIIG